MPIQEISRTAPDLSGYIPATRAYCRLGENTSQDALIGQLLDAALLEVEQRISGPVAITEYSWFIDQQPDLIIFPFRQVISVEGVFVLMDDGTETEQEDTWTWDTWRLYLKNDQVWDESDKQYSLMRIDFTGGYATLPDEIITALKVIVKWRLDNDIQDYPETVQRDIDRLLAKFKTLKVIS